jgi:hypothetical protein
MIRSRQNLANLGCVPELFTMAPGILAPEPTFTVTPMARTQKEKHDFGAVIEGLDLENISGEALEARLTKISKNEDRFRCPGAGRCDLDPQTRGREGPTARHSNQAMGAGNSL